MKLIKVECIDTKDYTYDIDELDLEGIVEELLASVPAAMKDDTVKVEE